MRFTEKLGTQGTLDKTKYCLSPMVLVWVAKAVWPLGSLMDKCIGDGGEVKRSMELTMWSVAPMSMIHLWLDGTWK